jgi:hypothetical protein
VRDHGRSELEHAAREPGFWQRADRASAALDAVRAADFTLGAIPVNHPSTSGSSARVRLGKADFVAYEYGGIWYVAETGL